MHYSRTISKLPALVAAAALGLTACSDEPSTGAITPRVASVPVGLEVSSANARVGDRIAVAVDLDAAPGSTGGIQGALEFDATRLKYVGQSPVGEAVAVVNAKGASRGTLRFASFNAKGITGRVALFVFEAKASNYVPSLKYVHQAAGNANSALRSVAATVRDGAVIDPSLAVPSDASVMTVADWAARLSPTSTFGGAVSARPGEYRLNLKYGDVDFDGTVGLFDLLGVANASVGLDNLIVDTDGAVDVDLVIAGNVFPDNSAGACGTETDGSRVLDLFDLLAIANENVGLPEPCVGDVIPGRGPLPTTRQSITATSAPDLIVGPGETVTLTNDRVWQLEGILRVQNGGTLNIEAGTRIEGLTNAAETQAIFVNRGGRIFANGTQNQPIVMTCTAVPKVKGCWGGVFIAGRSTVNLDDGIADVATPEDAGPGAGNSRAGEGNAPRYGGDVPTDNSGRFVYTIIEYAGKVIGANNELNGLTLGAVGSGTEIHHVQIHGGTDDGIEFFGGTVNTSNLVLTGNDDDGFDVSFGLTGDHQYVIIQSDAGASNNDSKAIEADGNESPGTFVELPRTSPRLWNFTIIGNLALRTQNSAIHLRRGSGLRFYNSLISGYEIGVDFDDAATCSAFGDGPVQVLNTTFVDVPNLGQNDGSDPLCGSATSTTEGEEEYIRAQSSNREVVGISSILVNANDTNLPDWRMLLIGGQPAEGGTLAPSTIPLSIAQATNYRGAVAPRNVAGVIPWYAGWTRPFQTATAP